MNGPAHTGIRTRLLVLGTLLITLLFLTAADWPTYLHDNQHTANNAGETTLSNGNVGQLTLAWSYQTGGPIATSPTVVNGVTYVGSWDGYEYALNALTGALIWKTYLGITRGNSGCYPQMLGVSSVATVQSGVVYVGGSDPTGGNNSQWFALDANTGNILWSVPTGDNSASGGVYNWASPLIYNGYAYIGIASLGDCPLVQGKLLQVSLATHQIVSTLALVPNGQVGGGIWTSPTIDTATNTIYLTTGTQNQLTQNYAQAIMAVDASTLAIKSYWNVPTAQTVIDSDWGSSPTLFTDSLGDQLVSAVDKNGYLYTFDRTNLAAGPLWQHLFGYGGQCPTPCGDGSVSSGAFANGVLYQAGGNTTINGVGYSGFVRAYNPLTGAPIWQQGTTSGPVVPALAAANGFIVDGAGSTVEVRDASTGSRLYSYTTGATLFGPPSIANGMIYEGSTDQFGSHDNRIYAFNLPLTGGSPTATPTPDPGCPGGWICQDIGSPSPAGSETTSGGTWTVQSGGSGVGGSGDQFRFISQNATGDAQITAHIAAVNSQGGLTFRQSSDPGSPYYAVMLTSGNTLVVQYRTTFSSSAVGGTTSKAVSQAGAAPLYLEIQRNGDQFVAATSTDGINYAVVPGSLVSLPLPASVQAGVFGSSGVAGTGGSATFDTVAIGSPTGSPNTPTPANACPSGWTCSDVGNPSLVGNQLLSNGTWTVTAAGSGIRGYADQEHLVWQSLSGSGSVSARVISQTNTNKSAKAGVVLRQNNTAGAAFYGAFLTPQGIEIDYRQGSYERSLVSISGTTAPIYLQVVRSFDSSQLNSTFTTFTSSDGINWMPLAGSVITWSLAGTMVAGIAVTSNNNTNLSTATFDTVNISPSVPNTCPDGWTCQDVGSPPNQGNQYVSGGTWQVQGGGSDIYSVYDQFRFEYQSLAGDGSVSARVVSQSTPGGINANAKSGVMLRATADPGSPYYAVLITPGQGILVQYRSTQSGGISTSARVSTASPPIYVQVTRTGTTFSAATSGDGNTWTPISGSSITLSLTGTLLAGLAVTSHDSANVTTTTFDIVSITGSQQGSTATPTGTATPTATPTTVLGATLTVTPSPSGTATLTATATPAVGCATGWTCADVGAPALAGSQSLSGSTWTVQGAGADIFGTADQFHYVWQPVSGDGSVSARVTAQQNTSAWAKAGVMFRQDTTAGSAFYAAFVTPGNGVAVQYRVSAGAGAGQQVQVTGLMAPIYLQVARVGSTYTAYTSTDGSSWTLLAGSSKTLTMSGPTLAGMADTSHNTSALSAVTFDSVTISSTVPPTLTPTATATPFPCPSGWSCADIGSPLPSGNQTLSGSTWTLWGGGADIWGTADQFHYVWQPISGDGSVSTQVTAQQNTDAWAKAGVMFRQDTTAGSAFYAAFVTPGNGVVVQYRVSAGAGAGQSAQLSTMAVPAYLEVARVGSTYTAYTSSDGATWTPVAGSSITLTMPNPTLAGMAVTSHTSAMLSSVTFSNTSISAAGGPTQTPTPTLTATNTPLPPTSTPTPTATTTNTPVLPTSTSTNTPVLPTATSTNTAVPPTSTSTGTNTPVPPTPTSTNTPVLPTPTSTNTPLPPTATLTSTVTATPFPCPSGWNCADIGTPPLAGSQVLSGTTWTISGEGMDIGGTADQFHFVWQALPADGGFRAHVLTEKSTNSAAKAGVMLRLSTSPSAPLYAVVVTPNKGILVLKRSTQGGGVSTVASIAGITPVYLQVARVGTSFTVSTSSDGSTWTAIGGSTVSLSNLSGSLLAGMAVTSKTSITPMLNTATFDTVSTP